MLLLEEGILLLTGIIFVVNHEGQFQKYSLFEHNLILIARIVTYFRFLDEVHSILELFAQLNQG